MSRSGLGSPENAMAGMAWPPWRVCGHPEKGCLEPYESSNTPFSLITASLAQIAPSRVRQDRSALARAPIAGPADPTKPHLASDNLNLQQGPRGLGLVF
jgi:hypothetical protein